MTAAERDIDSRTDIVQLVDAFYERVRADEVPSPAEDVRLLGGRAVQRIRLRWQPAAVHRELASRVPLGAREFGQWLALFCQSVDALFCGPGAEGAKVRASRIAAVMRHHILADQASQMARVSG